MSKSNRARQQRARERIAQIRAEETRRRRRLWLAGGTAVVVAIGLVVGLVLALSGGGAKAASPAALKARIEFASGLTSAKPPASGSPCCA